MPGGGTNEDYDRVALYRPASTLVAFKAHTVVH
jgi:hypothetical protein